MKFFMNEDKRGAERHCYLVNRIRREISEDELALTNKQRYGIFLLSN